MKVHVSVNHKTLNHKFFYFEFYSYLTVLEMKSYCLIYIIIKSLFSQKSWCKVNTFYMKIVTLSKKIVSNIYPCYNNISIKVKV